MNGKRERKTGARYAGLFWETKRFRKISRDFD